MAFDSSGGAYPVAVMHGTPCWGFNRRWMDRDRRHLMLLLIPALLVCFFLYRGLDIFDMPLAVRLVLAALPIPATALLGLYGLIVSVAVTGSLFMKSP